MSYRQKKVLSGNMILQGESLQIHVGPQGLFELRARNSLSGNFNLDVTEQILTLFNLQVNSSRQSYNSALDHTVYINHEDTYMQFNSEHSTS